MVVERVAECCISTTKLKNRIDRGKALCDVSIRLCKWPAGIRRACVARHIPHRIHERHSAARRSRPWQLRRPDGNRRRQMRSNRSHPMAGIPTMLAALAVVAALAAAAASCFADPAKPADPAGVLDRAQLAKILK